MEGKREKEVDSITSNISFLSLAAGRRLTFAGSEEMKVLLECLECPVCQDITLPPIYNCETGHVICNLCKEKLVECPLCKAPYTTSRNFPLESLVRATQFNCNNRTGGCTVTGNIDVIQAHVENCIFNPIKCHLNGFDGCTGALLYASEYSIHLNNIHKLPSGDSSEGKAHVFRRNFTFSDWENVTKENHTWTCPLLNYNGRSFVSHVFSRGSLFYFGIFDTGHQFEFETVKYAVKITIQKCPLTQVPKYEVTLPVPSVMEFKDSLPHAVVSKSFLESLGHLVPAGEEAPGSKPKFKWCVRYEITMI